MKIKPDIYMAQRDQFAAGLLSGEGGPDAGPSRNSSADRDPLQERAGLGVGVRSGARAAYESSKAIYAQATASLEPGEREPPEDHGLSPRWTGRSAS